MTIEAFTPNPEGVTISAETMQQAEHLLEDICHHLAKEGDEDAKGRHRDPTIRTVNRVIHDILTPDSIPAGQQDTPALHQQKQEWRSNFISALAYRIATEESTDHTHLAGLVTRIEQYFLLRPYYEAASPHWKTYNDPFSPAEKRTEARETINAFRETHWAYRTWDETTWASYLLDQTPAQRKEYYALLRTHNVQTNIPMRYITFDGVVQHLDYHKDTYGKDYNLGTYLDIGSSEGLGALALVLSQQFMGAEIQALTDDTDGALLKTTLANTKPPHFARMILTDIKPQPDELWVLACSYPGELEQVEDMFVHVDFLKQSFILPPTQFEQIDVTHENLLERFGIPIRVMTMSMVAQQLSIADYEHAIQNGGDALEEGGMFFEFALINDQDWHAIMPGHSGTIKVTVRIKAGGKLTDPLWYLEIDNSRVTKSYPAKDTQDVLRLAKLPQDELIEAVLQKRRVHEKTHLAILPRSVAQTNQEGHVDTGSVAHMVNALSHGKSILWERAGSWYVACRPERHAQLAIQLHQRVTQEQPFLAAQVYQIMTWGETDDIRIPTPLETILQGYENIAVVRLPANIYAHEYFNSPYIDSRGYIQYLPVADLDPLFHALNRKDIHALAMKKVPATLLGAAGSPEEFAYNSGIPLIVRPSPLGSSGSPMQGHPRIELSKRSEVLPHGWGQNTPPHVIIVENGGIDLPTILHYTRTVLNTSEVRMALLRGNIPSEESFALPHIETLGRDQLIAEFHKAGNAAFSSTLYTEL